MSIELTNKERETMNAQTQSPPISRPDWRERHLAVSVEAAYILDAVRR
jgi:hypothetical protein